VAIVAMHAAIGILMGMYLFALVMIVLNVAAFGADAFVLRNVRDASSAATPDN
jgi:hypothetical protein